MAADAMKSKYSCKRLNKWKNYFYIYDKLFEKYRNKKIIFVEIRVFSGGSLIMWRNFFGKKAKIIGIDLNPESKKFEKYGFKIFIGDQSKDSFWRNFFSKIMKSLEKVFGLAKFIKLLVYSDVVRRDLSIGKVSAESVTF